MAEHKLFNTKILLRNDERSKWIESELSLGKGEVALSWEDGNCKLKVGDGEHKWSDLDYLALDESQISSFLSSLEIAVDDLGERLDAAEDNISDLSANAKTYELSASIDNKSFVLVENSISGGEKVGTVFTIPDVITTDESEDEDALATKKYVDDAISAVEESVAEGLDDIRAELSSAWHVKGVLTPPNDNFPGKDFNYTPLQLYKDGEKPQDGDIVINKNIEYVWASGKWNELGNEGNYAVKGAIVNADIANNAKIDQTKIAGTQGNETLAEDIEKLVFNAYYRSIGETEISSLEDVISANESILSNANKGDILVINSRNVSANFGRQSFVFAGIDPLSAPCWETLNEKYDASNVYFKSDITAMYKFGKYDSASTASPTTISCAGKSVATMFEEALTEILQPSATLPTASISASGGTGEVGSSYNIPDAKLTFKAGSYTYGPATNISVAISAATLSCTTTSEHSTNTSVLVNNGVLDLTTAGTNKYTDSTTSYTFKGTLSYGDSPTTPENNIGTTASNADEIKISAASATVTDKTVTFKGYRKGFFGYVMKGHELDLTKLTASNIRNDINATTFNFDAANKSTSSKWPTTFTVKKDSTQIIFAVPKEVIGTNHQYIKMNNSTLGDYTFDNNGLLRTVNLSVDGATSGEDLTEYAVWTINPPGAFAGTYTYNITYSINQLQS